MLLTHQIRYWKEMENIESACTSKFFFFYVHKRKFGIVGNIQKQGCLARCRTNIRRKRTKTAFCFTKFENYCAPSLAKYFLATAHNLRQYLNQKMEKAI